MSHNTSKNNPTEQIERLDVAEKLRKDEASLQLMIEQIPAILWTTDRDLRITSSLGAGLAALGLEPNQLVGMTFQEYLGNDDPEFLPNVSSYRALAGESVHYEMIWEENAYETHIEPLRDAGGTIVGTIGVALDVTERHRALRTLQESEENFRILGENIPGVVYLCANDKRYTMKYLNEAVQDLVGIPAKEFLEDRVSFVELHHPEESLPLAKKVEAAIEKRSQYHLIYRLRHADQRWIWVEEYGQGVFDEEGNLRFLEGTIFNITSKKLADEEMEKARDELELRVFERTAELSTTNEALRAERRRLLRLLDLHERERQLVAFDIHDGMVQDMTASIMFFEAAGAAQPDMTQTAKKHCERALSLVRKAVDEARRMINGLRPPVLEQQGLTAAIESLIAHLPADPPLDLQFECDVNFQRLVPALEMAIYRIIQEGLNNIRRHSGAKQAKIILRQVNSGIDIIVQDSGHGFVTHEEKAGQSGMRGIRERARLLGGTVHVESKPGEGTCLHVHLPLSDAVLPPVGEEAKEA